MVPFSAIQPNAVDVERAGLLFVGGDLRHSLDASHDAIGDVQALKGDVFLPGDHLNQGIKEVLLVEEARYPVSLDELSGLWVRELFHQLFDVHDSLLEILNEARNVRVARVSIFDPLFRRPLSLEALKSVFRPCVMLAVTLENIKCVLKVGLYLRH